MVQSEHRIMRVHSIFRVFAVMFAFAFAFAVAFAFAFMLTEEGYKKTRIMSLSLFYIATVYYDVHMYLMYLATGI